ncbi:MAG: HNH endonuclease [Acidobacteriota bacterium]|nr:HNH endonuclease [Acidobacteriota bacterium]
MTEPELRQAVRRAYDFACGYCGVREEDAGSLLELDHFEPRSAGGGDGLENLVYCCTTCNRLKGDFWSTSTTEKRLLHPQRDDFSQHLRFEPDGLFTALTETGSFHLARLRLNRPPLVALRRERAENAGLRDELEQAQAVQKSLRERLVALDNKIERILEELVGFWGE